MPSGLYIAASGMDSVMMRQNVIANNLANLNTVGFKQNRSVDIAYPTYTFARLHDQRINTLEGSAELRPIIGMMGGGMVPQEITTDYSQGARLETQNPLDFALTGPGYFAVSDPAGQTYYTRNGSFNLDGDGKLVTKDGYTVLGRNGEIFIDGSRVEVDVEGNISVDGKALDQLMVVNISDETRLVKAGHSLFKLPTGTAVDTAPDDLQIQQGFLEQSNVNSVKEMVAMIEASRTYEMNAKVISLFDDILGRAASDLGSLRV